MKLALSAFRGELVSRKQLRWTGIRSYAAIISRRPRFGPLCTPPFEDLTGIDQEYVNSAEYKKEIMQARCRIFGYAIGNNLQSGHKLLKRKLIGEQLVKWYPLPIQHLDERFQDPRLERRMEKLELKRKQGKIKHKRGKNKAPPPPPTKGKKK